VELSPIADRLRRALIAAANRAGGWPYYAGKSPRVEPTCWALLALAGSGGRDAATWLAFADLHRRFLSASQRADGLLVDAADGSPNFTANGLAACVLPHVFALDAAATSGPSVSRLLAAIVSVKGVSVDTRDPTQDDRLQGWPWIADTFSWIEPTCWCVLALKKARAAAPGADARIQEADKLIANRSCEAGGWNYGNASRLGQDLRPYVPTTALGLLAMQDRREDAVVARALAWLDRARASEPSALALSLAAIALRVYGKPVDDLDARLSAGIDRAERLGNVQSLALMLYALTAADHRVQALRL